MFECEAVSCHMKFSSKSVQYGFLYDEDPQVGAERD